MDKNPFQVMPPLSKDEYEGLKAQIAQYGVLVPVEYDEEGNILDGFHRVQVCQELGIANWPSITRIGLTETEKRTYARTVNSSRRHLTREQKRQLIRDQLLDTPELSNRQIAQIIGTTPDTVITVRSELEVNGQVSNFDTLIGLDGKKYPAKTPTDMGGLYSHNETNRKYKSGEIKKLQAEAPDLLEEVRKGGKTIPQAKRELVKRQRQESPPLPSDKYRILYADPPWKYSDSGIIGETDHYGHTARHYPSMTIKELCDMGEQIKDISEDNAVLFLWVTSPLLEECFDVIRKWGFTYKASFVWDKIRHNFGHYNSVRHEFLLICTKGSCTPDISTLIDSVQSIEKSNIHSEKPEAFRTIIDTLYTHGKRLELFARKEVDNWEAWGNEPG